MTIAELLKLLTEAVAKGHGDGPVYFDAEARTFNYHLVQIDSAHVDEDPDTVTLIAPDATGFLLLTTRYH